MTIQEVAKSGKWFRRATWTIHDSWLYVEDGQLRYQDDGSECQLDLDDIFATDWEIQAGTMTLKEAIATEKFFKRIGSVAWRYVEKNGLLYWQGTGRCAGIDSVADFDATDWEVSDQGSEL